MIENGFIWQYVQCVQLDINLWENFQINVRFMSIS